MDQWDRGNNLKTLLKIIISIMNFHHFHHEIFISQHFVKVEHVLLWKSSFFEVLTGVQLFIWNRSGITNLKYMNFIIFQGLQKCQVKLSGHESNLAIKCPGRMKVDGPETSKWNVRKYLWKSQKSIFRPSTFRRSTFRPVHFQILHFQFVQFQSLHSQSVHF